MSALFSPTDLVVPFENLRMTDVEAVGGKNASLGEMISQLPEGVKVPTGLCHHGPRLPRIPEARRPDRPHQRPSGRTGHRGRARPGPGAGAEIRAMVEAQPFPAALETAIREEPLPTAPPATRTRLCRALVGHGRRPARRLVRWPAGNLPERAWHRRCAAQDEGSVRLLYNDRAISYRVHKGFAHADVALSAGVQRMVRSDRGAAGVMFTIDTETGFEDVVFITSSYGLGETVVQGAVNPDEFYVHKPMLVRASAH
jgi:pyruvate,water dikinase